MRVTRVVAVLATLFAAPTSAAEFQSLETQDLRLVYPGRALGFVVPYTARCFQNSLAIHRDIWNYTSTERVNIILDDFGDYGNAGVWVAPRNSMVVHIAPTNFVYETGPANERINFTMNHEMVHVVALDQSAGMDQFFRGLFLGKVRETSEQPLTMLYTFLTIPRRASPRWYHEGAAVFFETWMAGGLGRAQGPWDEMVFRSIVRDSAHLYDPLGLESEGTKVDWQVGVNSYLYGTRFMCYLAHEYSPDHLVRWIGRLPGSRAYFSSQFRQVFGRPLGDIWAEWLAWERTFQRANLDSIRRYPVTNFRDLSGTGLGSVSRAHRSADGREMYVAVNYPGTVAHIAAIDLNTGKARELQEVKGPALYFVSSLAYDPAHQTLFYSSDNNDWRDLWALDLPTGKTRRLIRDARIGDLAFNRNDSSLWAVRHFNGISTVVRLEAPYTSWTRIWSAPYGLDLYDLDISPDGTLISASMAEISGRQTLRTASIDAWMAGDTTTTEIHDFGTSIPQGFVFSPDGRYLFGSSYYTGVSNIFRYDLAADSMDIVTNTETGFFRPLPESTDSLIVFRYSGEGFVPARIRATPLTDVSAITFLGQQVVEKHPVVRDWLAPPPSRVDLQPLITRQGNYRALASVRPANLYPVVEAYRKQTAVGVRINLSDPIGIHEFDATVSYTGQEGLREDERWHWALGYDRWNLSARYYWNRASFYDLVGPREVSRKGHGGFVTWERPLIRDKPRTLDLTVTASGYAGLEVLPGNQNVEISPGFERFAGLSASLFYKNTRTPIGAVDPVKGWQGGLQGEGQFVNFQRIGGKEWDRFPRISGTLDAGMPMPIRNSSLWLRTAAGQTEGDPDDPFANFFFGAFGNNGLDYGEVKRYHSYESFPGVDFDAIAGNNFARALVELNLPAWRFRRAGTLALYASWARLTLFGTGLVTNLERSADRTQFQNAGAQVDVRFQLFTQQPLTFSVGYAHAWNRRTSAGEEWMVSLKLL